MTDFITKHPEIIWGIVSMLLTVLLKPRTPEEYDLLPPRVAAFLKVVSALGFDAPKAVEGLRQIATGKKDPPKDV